MTGVDVPRLDDAAVVAVPTQHLSADDIRVLKFAACRQLSRWANRPDLDLHQQAQRATLQHVVRVLQQQAFVSGCELRGGG